VDPKGLPAGEVMLRLRMLTYKAQCIAKDGTASPSSSSPNGRPQPRHALRGAHDQQVSEAMCRKLSWVIRTIEERRLLIGAVTVIIAARSAVSC